MTAITRVRDWRSKLSTAIEDRRRVPFSEKNNCGIFLADCIIAMTGVDIFEQWPDRFRSRAEALVLLRKAGYADFCVLLAKYFEEIHPSQARAGDVMAFPTEDQTGWAAGVVNGERVTVLNPAGLGTVSRDGATRAFRVP